jgi:hypothetical protein
LPNLHGKKNERNGSPSHTVSHQQALEKTGQEYKKYKSVQNNEEKELSLNEIE